MKTKDEKVRKQFAYHYATIGSKSYHNATQSLLATGYKGKTPRERACKLLKEKEVQKEIAKITLSTADMANIKPQWVKDQAILLYNDARERGDNLLAKNILETIKAVNRLDRSRI